MQPNFGVDVDFLGDASNTANDEGERDAVTKAKRAAELAKCQPVFSRGQRDSRKRRPPRPRAI